MSSRHQNRGQGVSRTVDFESGNSLSKFKMAESTNIDIPIFMPVSVLWKNFSNFKSQIRNQQSRNTLKTPVIKMLSDIPFARVKKRFFQKVAYYNIVLYIFYPASKILYSTFFFFNCHALVKVSSKQSSGFL